MDRRIERSHTLFVRLLRRYARPKVPQYLVGALMLLLTNWVVVRIPALIGDALSVLESGGASALLDARSIARELALLGIVVIVVRTLSRVLFFNPGREIEHRLGVDLFAHLLSLQRPFYLRHKVGELVSLASNDTTSVRLLVGFAGLQLCNVAVAVPLHVYQMIATDAVLTAWCIAPMVLGALYLRATVRRFFDLVREGMALLARLSDRVLESYSGIATVRSHAAEDATLARFDALNEEYLALQLRVATIRAFGMPVLGLSGLVSTAIVLWVGGERVLQGAMQIGDIATFSALLLSLVATLTGLAWVLAAISRGLVSLRRIEAVIQTPADIPPAQVSTAFTSPPQLELRNLSFGYPGSSELSLQDVSVSVSRGHTLGIFGETGSGKSTLIELLSRVFTPPPRAVFLDGVDIRDIDLGRLREGTAVVPQTAHLFSTSLRENITLGSEASDDDERLQHAVDAAALRDDLGQLPAGLETIVGERGVMLSGGQRQRAALARALYLDRPLLLLDDVLSAVDQTTETRMVAAIRRLGRHTVSSPTTVIVSHRTSVLEHADEILVLSRGRVIERGTHAQLLRRGGEYARAHLHQVEENAAAEALR